jgi:cobalt/nickel transport system permease protein
MTEQSFIAHAHAHRHGGFIERLVADLLAVMEHALYSEHLAQTEGLLQRFDPRVKVLGTLMLISATVFAHRIPVILGLFTAAVAFSYLSGVPLRILARGIWASALLFTGAIALPAIFIVPGEVLYRLPLLGWPLTAQGLASAAFLVSRAVTAATFAALLILCTPWPQVLKALRVLGVPVVLVVILSMTHRYIFLLLQTAQAMFEARQSRLVGTLTSPEHRRIVAASVGVLLSKSFYLADEVFLAMQSRGYRGEHFTLDDFQMKPFDWAGFVVIVALAALAFWFGS